MSPEVLNFRSKLIATTKSQVLKLLQEVKSCNDRSNPSKESSPRYLPRQGNQILTSELSHKCATKRNIIAQKAIHSAQRQFTALKSNSQRSKANPQRSKAIHSAQRQSTAQTRNTRAKQTLLHNAIAKQWRDVSKTRTKQTRPMRLQTANASSNRKSVFKSLNTMA